MPSLLEEGEVGLADLAGLHGGQSLSGRPLLRSIAAARWSGLTTAVSSRSGTGPMNPRPLTGWSRVPKRLIHGSQGRLRSHRCTPVGPGEAALGRAPGEAGGRERPALLRRRSTGATSQNLYRFCLSIVGSPEDAQRRPPEHDGQGPAGAARGGAARSSSSRGSTGSPTTSRSSSCAAPPRRSSSTDDLAAPGGGPAETTAPARAPEPACSADLAELPESQRSTLVMRELGGPRLDQIAEAFDTSSGGRATDDLRGEARVCGSSRRGVR